MSDLPLESTREQLQEAVDALNTLITTDPEVINAISALSLQAIGNDLDTRDAFKHVALGLQSYLLDAGLELEAQLPLEVLENVLINAHSRDESDTPEVIFANMINDEDTFQATDEG